MPPVMLINLLNIISKKIIYFSGEKGHCLLKTEANVLFCDLTLKPGESKTCKSIFIVLK